MQNLRYLIQSLIRSVRYFRLTCQCLTQNQILNCLLILIQIQIQIQYLSRLHWHCLILTLNLYPSQIPRGASQTLSLILILSPSLCHQSCLTLNLLNHLSRTPSLCFLKLSQIPSQILSQNHYFPFRLQDSTRSC
jgi:hypothetical protein